MMIRARFIESWPRRADARRQHLRRRSGVRLSGDQGGVRAEGRTPRLREGRDSKNGDISGKSTIVLEAGATSYNCRFALCPRFLPPVFSPISCPRFLPYVPVYSPMSPFSPRIRFSRYVPVFSPCPRFLPYVPVFSPFSPPMPANWYYGGPGRPVFPRLSPGAQRMLNNSSTRSKRRCYRPSERSPVWLPCWRFAYRASILGAGPGARNLKRSPTPTSTRSPA